MEKIGSGTYGTVYLIDSTPEERQNGWPNRVVLKVAPRGCLRHEMKVLLDLQDVPGVVKFRGYNEGIKTSNLLMDYGGIPLYRLSHENRLQERKSILKQILAFLKGLHEMGYIHGDLKPANIVFHPETKKISVIDFGFTAKFRDCKIRTPLQTEEYRAPEVWQQGQHRSRIQVNDKVDLWSVGIIMAELFLGWETWRLKPGSAKKRSDMTPKDFIEQYNQFVDYIFEKSDQVFTEKGAMKLLGDLLRFDSSKRLSAAKALEYSYFRDSLLNKPDAISN